MNNTIEHYFASFIAMSFCRNISLRTLLRLTLIALCFYQHPYCSGITAFDFSACASALLPMYLFSILNSASISWVHLILSTWKTSIFFRICKSVTFLQALGNKPMASEVLRKKVSILLRIRYKYEVL